MIDYILAGHTLVFMCTACQRPLLYSDLVVDNFGEASCCWCGTVVADDKYWNDQSVATYKSKSLYYFECDDDVGTVCVECGNLPYDETDGVVIDNFGAYICTCGGALEVIDWEY